MGHLLYGYKMGPRGRIVHRQFDSDELMTGHAKRDGWVDSPNKVPGYEKAEEARKDALAATAHTVSPEPPRIGTVHGDEVKRKPGRPRKS
jgi:hypothetical protein